MVESQIVLGATIGLLITVATVLFRYAYDTVMDIVSSNAEDIERLEEEVDAAREVGSAALASIYGSDERPDDDGFVQEFREDKKTLHDRMDDLEGCVETLREDQRRHASEVKSMLEGLGATGDD